LEYLSLSGEAIAATASAEARAGLATSTCDDFKEVFVFVDDDDDDDDDDDECVMTSQLTLSCRSYLVLFLRFYKRNYSPSTKLVVKSR
jgi:hypothetical protein